MKPSSRRGAHALLLASLLAVGLVGACEVDETAPDSPAPGVPTTPDLPPLTPPPGSPFGEPEPSPPDETGQGGNQGTGGGGFAEIPRIVAEVQPSVVSILRAQGQGSGVVWSEDGIVVTNHHVIDGADELVVVFADGERAPARVLASDPRSDLAVVRVERTGLPPADFADEVPPVGSLAIALGNPLGFENSVTAGIVSGVNRSFPDAARRAPALIDLIQTDAAISPGNSGGALVGSDGRVIGINVAYIPPQARAVAIGFAIPAPTVIDVVEQLLANGVVEHAFLGVELAPLTTQIVERYGIGRDTGALVIDMLPDGPAAAGGLEAGDVVVAFNEQPVTTVEDLLAGLRRMDPGDIVVLTVARNGDELDVEVTLGTLPP
jgi:serine protease DegQ